MDYSKYRLHVDNPLVTFYLYNLSGQLVGYHRYNFRIFDKGVKNDPRMGRYYTKVSRREPRDSADPRPRDTLAVWGLEVLDRSKKTLYIVEGVFKAAVLHRLGFNAIAVLTATPKPMKPWFKVMRQQFDLVGIGDPDAAGQKLVNTVGKGFQSPKDLDEMTDQEILELLRKNA